MAQPVWVTPAGSLGTIAEGIFYQIPLVAYDPNEVPDPIYYQVIAGSLPPGIQCNETGLIVGLPMAKASIQGVPLEVNRDVTSKFAVRAYTKTTVGSVTIINRLADRTFTITVTGPNTPEFITPAGTVATYYDGTLLSGLQIEYTDSNPLELVIIKLVAGALPTGTTISPSGLITGLIAVNPPDTAIVTYEFVLEVTNGINSNLRTFNIVVYNVNDFNTSTTMFTVDSTYITADVTPVRLPIILTPVGSIGSVKNDNYFAFQFTGIDLDGSLFRYVLIGSIPGLTLDPTTGWLYGYIPNLGLVEDTYNFVVRAYKTSDPTYISPAYNYSLTISGPISSQIVWVTDSNLGTIVNGSTSILYVKAISKSGLNLQYQLKSGSDSSLPQGLQLLPSGDIAGRVSFNTFALDLGTTVFDNTPVNGVVNETTFDLKYTFTVNVYSLNAVVDIDKIFTVTVVREYNEPYENLYIQAMPPNDDRALINSLLQNSDIFPTDLIYRPTDVNFGVSTRVIYNHAFGLTASTKEKYYSSLDLNHYWKNLVLGEIKVAQATDVNNNVLYEVVYSQVIDNLLNDQGQSVSKQVTLPFVVTDADGKEVSQVYPNSLTDMRDQVIDVVGQVSNILPTWMLSTQTNGQVLGFVPAWVIAYAKPGQGNQIAYNIQSEFGNKLNLIDFEVDRYEVDRLLTYNWNPVTKNWIPTPPQITTFDINNHYQTPAFINDGGINYVIGDLIKILGSQVGGEDILNDILLVVSDVDPIGVILSVFCFGTAPLFSAGDTYLGVVGTNISGVGFGAVWDITVVPGNPTVFDGNSVKFTVPVNMYSNTTDFDQYLVFQKRNILSTIGSNPVPPNVVFWANAAGNPVAWTNSNGTAVNWINNT